MRLFPSNVVAGNPPQQNPTPSITNPLTAVQQYLQQNPAYLKFQKDAQTQLSNLTSSTNLQTNLANLMNQYNIYLFLYL